MKSKKDILMYLLEWMALAALVVFLLSSCSCDRAMARIEKHCPDLFEPVIVVDTFLIRQQHVDTIFSLQQLYDTVVIATPDSSASATLSYDGQNIELSLDRKADTIYVEKEITRYVRVSQSQSKKLYNLCTAAFATLVAVFLSVLTIRRRKK